MTPSLLARLSAIALKKYPPDIDNDGFYEDGREILRDGNERDRNQWLEIAEEVYELMVREIASEAYDEGYTCGYCSQTIDGPWGNVKKGYLDKQFPETDKKD